MNPCQNNATCDDLIGRYLCTCTEDFVGINCEKPRVVTCANQPCLRGNCSDLFDPVTELANNFTCHCPFGYEGTACDKEIDYCEKLEPCQNSATCESVPFEPVSLDFYPFQVIFYVSLKPHFVVITYDNVIILCHSFTFL